MALDLVENMRQLIDAPPERLLRICKANDPNGDFDGCTPEELLVVIMRWAHDDPDPGGTLERLLELAR